MRARRGPTAYLRRELRLVWARLSASTRGEPNLLACRRAAGSGTVAGLADGALGGAGGVEAGGVGVGEWG